MIVQWRGGFETPLASEGEAIAAYTCPHSGHHLFEPARIVWGRKLQGA